MAKSKKRSHNSSNTTSRTLDKSNGATARNLQPNQPAPIQDRSSSQTTSAGERPSARPNPQRNRQQTQARPPGNPTNFYLRVEGLNIGAVIEDTDKISVVRGASFLLREAITDIKKNVLPNNAIAVATGASIGEFQLPDTNQVEVDRLVAEIRGYLTDGSRPYRHLSFGVSAEGYQPNAGELAVREAALARIRFGQMRSPSLIAPYLNEDPHIEPCSWEGRRPADARMPIRRGGEKPIQVSTSVRDRWHIGVVRKQRFYRQEAFLADAHPAYRLRYSKDLSDLAGEPGAGNLNGKVAIIYADGNRFSQIRDRTCRRFVSLQRYDQTIKSRRREYLADLLKVLAEHPRGRIQGQDGPDRLRLETLLWGGDELLLVVPAWCGMDVLQHFFAFFDGWKHQGWNLTHAVGLVFCRANTPIQRSMKLAGQLAEGVKRRLKTNATGHNDEERLRSQLRNRFDYMVLESVDFPVEDDLDDYFQGRYGSAASYQQDLAPTPDWQQGRRQVADLLNSFPKAKTYAMARAAVAATWDTQAPNIAPYRSAWKRLVEVLGDTDARKPIGIVARLFGIPQEINNDSDQLPHPWIWLHLAELWDYLNPSSGADSNPPTASPTLATGGQS